MIRSFIALGSNLDQPKLQLQNACKALSAIPASRLDIISPCYRNRAIGPGTQPDYLNAVVQLSTSLPALQLLDALQSIEIRQHRIRQQPWGPRTLDLDLLLYGDQVINTERLIVPHPRMTERNFVLYPLADIAGKLQFPDGTSLSSLLDYCAREGLVLTDPIIITESQLDEPGPV